MVLELKEGPLDGDAIAFNSSSPACFVDIPIVEIKISHLLIRVPNHVDREDMGSQQLVTRARYQINGNEGIYLYSS